MNAIQIIDILREIETKYDVNKITCRGIHIWTYMRIKLYGNARQISRKINNKNFKILLCGLFRYNPFILFRRYKIWLFVDHERRKIIQGIAELRVSGAIPQIEKNTLVIEKNTTSFYHPKKTIPERYIISDSLLMGFVFLFEIYYRFFKLKIENESLLKEILNKYELSIDYGAVVSRLWAQYKAMNLFLLLFPNPELVFIECPYVSCGYVLAFRKKKIKVVEMQHGVINDKHFAYNSMIENGQYLPDKLFVYGNYEKEIFKNCNRWYVRLENIVDVGSYILEKISKADTSVISSVLREKFKCIVVISGVERYDSETINLLNRSAKLNKDIYYIYVPRKKKDYSTYAVADNFKIDMQNNIYFLLKECDIHVTVGSSTCFEANYFGKKTVFINFDNIAFEYYQGIFTDDTGGYFCDTPEMFVSIVEKEYVRPIRNRINFFKEGHYKNMEKQINQLLC